MIPKRRRPAPLGLREAPQIRSQGHIQWVRGHECSVAHVDGANCKPRIEAAHVRTGTDGGMGIKPGDNWTIPLCSHHHIPVQHQIGEPAFERKFRIDMKAIAAELWRKSPHRLRYEARHGR